MTDHEVCPICGKDDCEEWNRMVEYERLKEYCRRHHMLTEAKSE